jgi:hypothetical protein
MAAGNKGSDVLAIHAVCHAAMSWDAVSKVFDVERSFESRGEKASERCNKRRENRQRDEV